MTLLELLAEGTARLSVKRDCRGRTGCQIPAFMGDGHQSGYVSN